MSTAERPLSRRQCLKVLGRLAALPAVLALSGCGGGEMPRAEVEAAPVVPLKPVPKKKGVGKNQPETLLDPREMLKKKTGG